jgi:exopolysaccharide biosynthesis protein
MHGYRVFIFACVVCPAFCFSQLRWHNVDSLYKPLPPSFHVFETTDSIDNHALCAYYVSAKLKEKRMIFSTRALNMQLLTPKQYYLQENLPLLVVNGGFYSSSSRQNLSVIINNGKLVAYNIVSLRGIGRDSAQYYYPSRGAIGINRKRQADVAWIFTDSGRKKAYAFESAPAIAKGKIAKPEIADLENIDWQWWKMQTAMGGGPVLIHDGAVWITNEEEQIFAEGKNQKQGRTAMGYTNDGRLIILVIQDEVAGNSGGITLGEEAAILRKLGCYEALNLNGGSSSCMLINGKETIKPSDKEGFQPLPAVFIIKVDEKHL